MLWKKDRTRRQNSRSSTEADLRVTDDALHLAATLSAGLGELERVVLFAGIVQQDGVSTVASQVALALAQLKKGPVLLVDANQRAPELSDLFRVARCPGFGELLAGKAALEEAIRRREVVPGLAFLPAGKVAAESVLLSTAQWPLLLQAVRAKFRFVIVDSSALLSFVDTRLLAPATDGVVLVVSAGQTRKLEVIEARNMLAGLKVRLLGLVLSQRGRALSYSVSTNGFHAEPREPEKS